MQEKMCQMCKATKTLDQFFNCKNGVLGKSSYCKPCHNDHNRKKLNPKRRLELGRLWRANNRDHHNALVRKHYQANKEKFRQYERRNRIRRSIQVRCRKFRIPYSRYWEMFGDQDGKCAICFKSPKLWWSLQVDHCHATGKIRGLLCGPCNKALGVFGDDIDGLQRAIAYLSRVRSSSYGSTSLDPKRQKRVDYLAEHRAKTEARAAEQLRSMQPPDPKLSRAVNPYYVPSDDFFWPPEYGEPVG